MVANKVGIGTAIKERYTRKNGNSLFGADRGEIALPYSRQYRVGRMAETCLWEAVPGAYYAVYKSNGEGKLATFVELPERLLSSCPAKGVYCVTALDKANAESRIFRAW